LIAIDPVPQAIDEAKQRCAGLPAEFAVMWAPQDWPAGSFDLITLSEVLYYLTIEPLDVLADRVAASLRPGGYAILVHWIKETDYPLTGDQAAERFLARSRSWAKIIRQQRTADYRLDLVQRI
jgi:SAM-dependent methyltransferase